MLITAAKVVALESAGDIELERKRGTCYLDFCSITLTLLRLQGDSSRCYVIRGVKWIGAWDRWVLTYDSYILVGAVINEEDAILNELCKGARLVLDT